MSHNTRVPKPGREVAAILLALRCNVERVRRRYGQLKSKLLRAQLRELEQARECAGYVKVKQVRAAVAAGPAAGAAYTPAAPSTRATRARRASAPGSSVA